MAKQTAELDKANSTSNDRKYNPRERVVKKGVIPPSAIFKQNIFFLQEKPLILHAINYIIG
jgi:hypothetical protein